jgi:hypothetical protein
MRRKHVRGSPFPETIRKHGYVQILAGDQAMGETTMPVLFHRDLPRCLAALFGAAVLLAVMALWDSPPAGAAVGGQTINVFDNHGGSVAQYDRRWAKLAAEDATVRIVGPCQSACTVLLGHIPRTHICVTPQAAFGFHLAHLPSAQATLWAAYQPDIRSWIQAHGGLRKDFMWMRAPDVYRYFKKC